MPDVLVTGGGGSFEGLAATLMRAITNGQGLGGPGNGQAVRGAIAGDGGAQPEPAPEARAPRGPGTGDAARGSGGWRADRTRIRLTQLARRTTRA